MIGLSLMLLAGAEPLPIRLDDGAVYALVSVSRHADRIEASFEGVPSAQPATARRPPRLHFSFDCDAAEYRLDEVVVQTGERQTTRFTKQKGEGYRSIDDGTGFRPLFSAACQLA